MLTKNINFKNFIIKSKTSKVKKDLDALLRQDLGLINSLKPAYKYNFSKKLVLQLKKHIHKIVVVNL